MQSGQRMYGSSVPGGSGYHPTVSYNGIDDPQGTGFYRQPGPPDFQPGQFYSTPGSQRPGVGVYPKSAGRPVWGQGRYGGIPQTSTLNQLLQGPAPDGWNSEYGLDPRPMVDSSGGNQPGWPQQQHQILAPSGGPSAYSNRQQSIPHNSQVLLLIAHL